MDLTENQKTRRGRDSSTSPFIEEHVKLAIETINCLLRLEIKCEVGSFSHKLT